METTHMDGRNFRTAFVLLLVLIFTALFLCVTWPFLQTLFVAAIFSGLCRPLFRWLVRLCKGRRSLASGLTILVIFLLIVGPISAFVTVVVKQAIGVSDQAIPWVQKQMEASGTAQTHDWLVKRFPSVAEYVPEQAKIVETIGNAAKTAGQRIVSGASSMGAGTATLLLNFFVMLYAMFFFLKDGTAILEKIFYYIPLEHDAEARMLERLTSVTRATVKGTLIIGLIQGTLAGIGFAVAGIGGAAFWGTLMVILSVVPGIGATLIWVPGVIYLFVTGQTMPAILLGIWCAAVVGTIDNVLRPTLVGKDAKMPDLLILVGTLGGLFLFGPIGFIIGPVVCGLFLTAWDIYGANFKNILPPVQSLRTGEVQPPPASLEETTEMPIGTEPEPEENAESAKQEEPAAEEPAAVEEEPESKEAASEEAIPKASAVKVTKPKPKRKPAAKASRTSAKRATA
ncbi:MAG TPA: AI-2E family transporter [Chthoniobacterales bacterium]|jgi:predicted PurR-regulated permease PerM